MYNYSTPKFSCTLLPDHKLTNYETIAHKFADDFPTNEVA